MTDKMIQVSGKLPYSAWYILHVTYDVYILQAAVEEYSVHTLLN